MCLFSKRLNEAIVRAKLSKRRGERHIAKEKTTEKREMEEGEGRGRGGCYGGAVDRCRQLG